MARIIAFIFARGGSKGLPKKNIRLLNDRPLIAHSIAFARQCPQITDVVVSTDDEEIATVAKEWGATVPFMRPASLALDTTPEMEAWRHAAEFYQEHIGPFDYFLSLPAVSPLRRPEDLTAIIKKVACNTADFILSASESELSPYSNLIEPRAELGFRLCGAELSSRRQDVKTVYRILPMYYACKVENIFKFDNLFSGKVDIIEIPRARAADVDTIEDFEYLQYLYERQSKSK
jgi:N-acylneuraminate cytidylyltransferase